MRAETVGQLSKHTAMQLASMREIADASELLSEKAIELKKETEKFML